MLTVAIPTFNRGSILVETIDRLLRLSPAPSEIIVADQTPRHDPAVEARLAEWSASGAIRWVRLAQPSIPAAMNHLLLASTQPVVLFLDDDIEPSPQLIAAHVEAHQSGGPAAVVGQILQPGEEPQHHDFPVGGSTFRFNHDRRCEVDDVMAGNLSVRRERAIEIGGFDENFTGAAYRFESDFALRLRADGGRILFEPAASLRHLHLSTGGLRSYGDHRSSTSPLHSAGDYYFALHHRHGRFWAYALDRIRRNVLTRWHLRHPWAIPFKLAGEGRGLLKARGLYRQGRRLIDGHAAGRG